MGCSLTEVKEILQDRDSNTRTNQQVIEWIRQKIIEIERKKDEMEQMLGTLNMMLEYRITMMNDPEKANS
ncbi:MerR family DNA-binding protein [Bacillus sp. JFL15]|uniref:MerR family DNA-binding protein n=1 Tax=Bacillus sp. JFL15 TaxID=1679193 RepID=UPI002F40690C